MSPNLHTKKDRLLMMAVIYAFVVAFVLFACNVDIIKHFLLRVYSITKPIILGLVTAYICNPIFKFFEKKCFYRIRSKGLHTMLSLILTIIAIIIIVAVLFLLIIPQLVDSITTFASNYENYVRTSVDAINNIIQKMNDFLINFMDEVPFEVIDADTLLSSDSETSIPNLLNNILDLASKNADSIDIRGAIVNAISTFVTFILTITIAILALIEKEYLRAGVTKISRALFPENVFESLSHCVRVANHSFGKFLEGKIIDSLIIGVLTYVLVSIFQIPYPILVATFVGVTNIVPVVGPIIGAVPTAFIILLADPLKVIPFILLIILIQQLDGNVIGPAILGNNTGVSSLCVMIAITTIGAIWGFVGMILGVPLYATIIILVEDNIKNRLHKNGNPWSLEHYYAPNSAIDPIADASSTQASIVKSWQFKVLHIRHMMQSGTEYKLSKKDRISLSMYHFFVRCHVIKDIPIETLVLSDTKESVLDAKIRTEDAFLLMKENYLIEEVKDQ